MLWLHAHPGEGFLDVCVICMRRCAIQMHAHARRRLVVWDGKLYYRLALAHGLAALLILIRGNLDARHHYGIMFFLSSPSLPNVSSLSRFDEMLVSALFIFCRGHFLNDC